MVGHKKVKNLLILTNFDFEKGQGAAFARLINYLKALEDEPWDIQVYSSLYQYSSITTTKLTRNANAMIGEPRKTSAIWEDFDFIGYRKFLNQAVQNFQSPNIIWLYNKITYPAVKTVLAKAKELQCKTVTEKNELEMALAQNYQIKGRNPIKRLVFKYLKFQKKLKAYKSDLAAFKFDGVVVISRRLEEFYSKHHNVIRIPILVDTEVVPQKIKEQRLEEVDSFKIGYFGQISEQKDGVFSLVRSVQALAKDYKVSCHLYGPATTSVLKELKKHLTQGVIEYHGSIKGTDVQNLLCSFQLLALVRPLNKQTDFGFSTKLGEYLASGTAVLATEISDNGFYLRDGDSAFLLPAEEQISEAQLQYKLKELILNPQLADKVGFNGRLIAEQNFDFKNYRTTLSDYLSNIASSSL